MDIEKTVQFKLTIGIYRLRKRFEEAGFYLFGTTELYTERFGIDWSALPPTTSEIPHRLLQHAESAAEAKAVEFQANRDTEWRENGVLYEESKWDNDPVWRGGGDVMECYKYWYDAFRSVHFLKLEWEDWRKS